MVSYITNQARVYRTVNNNMKTHWNKIDLVCITAIVVSYYFVSVIGLNWDHLELTGGYGLDPDGGGIFEALGYLYNLEENWHIGFKEYPQGYGILLALFYALAVSAATLAGKLPPFEIQMANQPYSRLLMAFANISSVDGRIFFTMVARGMSSLFGFFTILLVYMIGRDYFQSRRVGFIAALLLLSTYPFIMLTLVAKYPATATFFFLLSFYLSCNLLKHPSPTLYVYSGLGIGIAISMSYFSGLTLLVLFLAHAMSVRSEGDLHYTAFWFGKDILTALLMVFVGFLIFNPRFFAHAPTMVLETMAMLRHMQSPDRRADTLLTIVYTGFYGSVLHLRDEIGLPMLGSMLAGLVYAAASYSRRNAPYIFIGGLYLLIFPLYRASYFISTAYPVLVLLASHGIVLGLENWGGSQPERYLLSLARGQFSVPHESGTAMEHGSHRRHTRVHYFVLVLITTGISAQGIARIVAQNLINAQASNAVLARGWILNTLPDNSRFLVDSSGVRISDAVGQSFDASFYGGSRLITHNLQDIIHANGVDMFSAEYAVTGSDLVEFISDENIARYPVLKKNLSPSGFGFGLKEAYSEYTILLNENAVLLKEFPAGQWIGNDPQAAFGYQFKGVAWSSAFEFLSDSSSRTHGPPIKIYKLTPRFWQAMEAKLFTEKPAAVCAQSDNAGAPHNGLRLMEKNAVYDPTTKTFAIELCWQSDHSKIMNELTFSLDYASMLKRDFWYYIKRGISTVLGTNQRHRQIYREYFNLQGNSYRATTTFTVPDNMAKGDYVLRYYFADDPYNEIELARITQ